MQYSGLKRENVQKAIYSSNPPEISIFKNQIKPSLTMPIGNM